MKKDLVVFDCETYPNYILFACKHLPTGKVHKIEIIGEHSIISDDRKKLEYIMRNFETFGFNNLKFDIPIVLGMLNYMMAHEIHKMGDDIITNNLPYFECFHKYSLSPRYKKYAKYAECLPEGYDTFDIMNLAPGRGSLKLYGARMGCDKLQDLPIEPGSRLSRQQIVEISEYCVNDLNTTIELFQQVKGALNLRRGMVAQYGYEVLSKDDAQLAEHVLKTEASKRLDIYSRITRRMDSPVGEIISYSAPEYIDFKSDNLKELLKLCENIDFTVGESEGGKVKVEVPQELKDKKIDIGESQYKVRIGGLHSGEKSRSIEPCYDEFLIELDVASYYPSMIINLGISPSQYRGQFLETYKSILDARLEAKRNWDKIKNDTYKIVLNGTYGKFGNKWSTLCNHKNMLNVTLTGQLSLLMLIERLENIGVKVVSANTDGIVCLGKNDKYKQFKKEYNLWEKDTNLNLEETKFTGMYSRDVNCYFANTENGVKTTGLFKPLNLRNNPTGKIISDAVINYIIFLKPIEQTVRECTDIKKFIMVQKVTDGAMFDGECIGKVVRWVYTKSGGAITRRGKHTDEINEIVDCGLIGGNDTDFAPILSKLERENNDGAKVARAENCTPIMNISSFDGDIDHDKYITFAFKLLEDVGYYI